MKLLFLALNRADKEWKMPLREWVMAKAQFAVIDGEHFTRDMAGKGSTTYPHTEFLTVPTIIGKARRRTWQEVCRSLPVRARGDFYNDEAALKLLFLVLNTAGKEWKMPARKWTAAKAMSG
jgi:transposase-like protein